MFFALALAAGGCAREAPLNADLMPKTSAKLAVTSPSFVDGQAIPERYSANGQNVSPGLNWSGMPPGAKEVAIIMEDPDAPKSGGFAHWVVYGLAPDRASIPEAFAKQSNLGGAMQGKNDTGATGYFGPQPPPGKPHHYHFRVFATDAPLPSRPGATRGQVEQAMSGHVLAEGDLVGTYEAK